MTTTLPVVATVWTDVATQMTSFLALGIVSVGLAVVLGLKVVPKLLGAIRSAVGG